MTRKGRELPGGWDSHIPDAIWPESLLSAVRTDARALATPRVIDTILKWQETAQDSDNPESQQRALHLLKTLGRALIPEVARPPSEDFDQEGLTTLLPADPQDLPPRGDSQEGTVDGVEISQLSSRREILRPAEPSERRRNPLGTGRARRVSLEPPGDSAVAKVPLPSEDDTDARVRSHPSTGSALPPTEDFDEEDENPTRAFLYPEERGDKSMPTPSVEALNPEDDPPTRHIPLPNEVLQRRLDSIEAVLGLSEPEATQMAYIPPKSKTPSSKPRLAEDDDTDDRVSNDALAKALSEIQRVGVSKPSSRPRTSPSGPRTPPPPPPPDPPSPGNESEASRLAPKPGVIRRRSTRRPPNDGPPPTRPRAAMQNVRSLYAILLPFTQELLPLSYERRARRFWARWREVAGDRGVRREFIEDLLRNEANARNLAAELIAEVQTVDVSSVYALIEKIEQEEHKDSQERGAVGQADRHRSPVASPSVRVEGVAKDD